MIARALRIAVALVAAAAAACGRAPSSPPRATPPPLALRAEPHAPAWTANDLARLRDRLRAALGASALATSGLAVVDGDGRPLFTRRERRAFTPASTFKCLVAATAFATLGPAFRFETTLEALEAPRAGELPGDLYLVGGGDPLLTSDDLRGGIGALARGGIQAVRGGVVADASAFSGPEVNRAWDPDDLQYGYAAGTSALSLDGGTVEFHVAGGAPGTPARIAVRPATGAVAVRGVVTSSYLTDLAILREPDRNTFTFSGRVASGAEPIFWRPVIAQPLFAATVARDFLRARGITVDGPARTGIAPLAGEVLWRHRSLPLGSLVHRMLVTSDNHIAEMLLRAVGATRGAGTEANGDRVERGLFAREGVPTAGLRVLDGSGLAAGDRIAPLSLAMLLARTAGESFGPAFVGALPRVGIEGTVKWHHLSAALGVTRAKSGHITGVNALAGYVQTRRHGRIAFAFMVNDRRADDGPVDAGIDAALDVLAQS